MMKRAMDRVKAATVRDVVLVVVFCLPGGIVTTPILAKLWKAV